MELSTPEDGEAVQVSPLQVRAFLTDAIDTDAGFPPPPQTPSDAAVTKAAQESHDDGSSTSASPTTSAAAPAPVGPPITAAAPGCVY
jgi:hypothetical protein